MIDFLVVLNNDQVNRYGSIFPIETLESALSQSWEIGTPSCLSHDYHRPVAWIRGLCLYVEPEQTRLVGIESIPENSQESEFLGEGINYHLTKLVSRHFEPYESNLRKKLTDHLTSEAVAHFPDCAAFVDRDLALRVFPELIESKDKDGLVPLSMLKAAAPGIYEKNGLLIFAHQYFRRSLSRLNSLNVPFLEKLQASAADEGLDVRVAIDPDMVGLHESLMPHIELEYWWEPKFDDDINKIPAGITVHEATKQNRLFHGISRTEFWWYLQDERRTFECEEIRDLPSYGVGLEQFGCRYVHSMPLADQPQQRPHCDGAVRLYDMHSMIKRIDANLYSAGKHAGYTKLWRIDGVLATSEWKALFSDYFRDNHLVGEYFGGIDDNRFAPKAVAPEINSKPLSKYVPYDLAEGTGIRASISYHPRSFQEGFERQIIAIDKITSGSDTYRYVEADTVEVVKLLHRNSKNITMASDVHLIAFEDQTLNLPLILHYGKDATSFAGTL